MLKLENAVKSGSQNTIQSIFALRKVVTASTRKVTIGTMNLIISPVLLVFLFATNRVQGDKVTFVYKENSLLVSSEAYFEDEACLEPSFVSVFAGDSVYKQQGTKKIKLQTAEVYGTFFSNCTKKGATKSELYLFDEDPKLVVGGLDKATVSIAAKAYVQTSSCSIKTFVDREFGYNYTYYSCCEGESLEVPLLLDLSVKTYGDVYKERSNGSRKGPGFVTKYKSSSKCKDQQKSTFSNFVVGDVPFTEEVAYSSGDICKAKDGSSDRYSYRFKQTFPLLL
jgi:hypothetical protein